MKDCERACAEGGFGLCAYDINRECMGSNAEVSGSCTVQPAEGWQSFEICEGTMLYIPAR